MSLSAAEPVLPECVTRDRLTSPYFPNLSWAGLAAIVTLGGIFLLTSFNRLNHTDLWGHLNFGRWIAEHQALPTTDPFAAAPTDIPVLHAAWLAQWLGYEVQRLFGNEGLALAHALLVTLTAGVLMLAVARRGAPAVWAWSAGAAMFLLDLPIVGTIRPQLFGQLGAALFLLACAELPHRKHPLLWIPLVAALWANLHGSILMGLAILGLYAAGVTWHAFPEAKGSLPALLRDRRLWTVWGAVLLAVAASGLNPHGPWLLAQVALFNEHAALTAISEWRPLTPRSLTGVLMILSTAATALLVKRSPRKWEAYEVLLLLVFGLATLPAIRMLAWWAVVWPWVVVPHAAAAWRCYWSERTGEPVLDQDEPTSMRTVMAMGFVFMTAIIAPPTYSLIAGQSRGEGIVLVTDTPLYLADEAVRFQLQGRIATPMDWADFLVWKTDARLQPLVDSHVHLTDLETWKDYETIFRGDESWLPTLQRRQLRYLAVAPSRFPQLARRVLTEDLGGGGRVRILYQDQRSILAEIVASPAPTSRHDNNLFPPLKKS